MNTLFIIIPIGTIISLGLFLFFESKAINSNKNSNSNSNTINEKFENYDTVKYTSYFTIFTYILTLIISIVFYDSSYGLVNALLYIFLTSFIGSATIFLLKIKRNLLIKVFASFLYGAPNMIATAFAFLTSYIFSS